MSARRAAYRAAVAVAVEDATYRLMQDLEGIKSVHGMSDEEVAAAVRRYPTLTEAWLDWRLRQAPLTEQIPVVEAAVGDAGDL